MRRKVFKASLSKGSINKLIADLKDERQRILELAKTFTNKLGYYGVTATYTAMADNKYGPYIEFSKQFVNGGGADAKPITVVIVYGKNVKTYIAKWTTTASGRKEREAEVNPILMAEFGSGFFANTDEHENIGDFAGQGTFPDQVHAFDEFGWSWYENGVKHVSFGEAPAAPMLYAYEEMVRIISRCAREVFG